MIRLNCWEAKKCGRDKIGGKTCPAVTETKLHGVHGGTKGGRACWVVAGTLCGGAQQGSFAKKYDNCEKCDFYKSVRKQEGIMFQLSVMLLNKLKQNGAEQLNNVDRPSEISAAQDSPNFDFRTSGNAKDRSFP